MTRSSAIESILLWVGSPTFIAVASAVIEMTLVDQHISHKIWLPIGSVSLAMFFITLMVAFFTLPSGTGEKFTMTEKQEKFRQSWVD